MRESLWGRLLRQRHSPTLQELAAEHRASIEDAINEARERLEREEQERMNEEYEVFLQVERLS